MNFMKDKFDKLIFIKDRDYHLVFLHLEMGDTRLTKKINITKTTAMESYQEKQFESLISNIKSTKHCGICNSKEDPVDCENNKNKDIDWIVCDGPREDGSGNIFCNQWYHQDCIKRKYNKNKFNKEKRLDVYFGHPCKHNDWYKNLNNATKGIVVKNINNTRNIKIKNKK